MDFYNLPGWLTNKEFLLILLPALLINLIIDASQPFVTNWPIKNQIIYNTIMCLGGAGFGLLYTFILHISIDLVFIYGLSIPVISYILYKAEIWKIIKNVLNKFTGGNND